MYTERVMSPLLAEAFAYIKEERNQRWGRASNQKGEVAEWRCRQAASELCDLHTWLQSARRASRQEDARGIDVVVESDIGLLYIQVKSSRFCARKFRQKRPNSKAIVVIITPDMDDAKVRNKVYDALCRLRQHFMKKRLRNR